MEISFLKPGSKIVIAAPARCVLREEMAIAIEWLKEQGFVPVYDDALFAQHHIFAGSDDFRAAVFQHYLDSEEIEAIWCARGGYGSIRIVDRLDFSKFLEHPKWLVGFSDITVFHGKLNRLGVPTLHASMPFYFANKTPEAKQSLYDALTETFPETDGKILFIEEVDEYIYHIDRMMHCLKRAGKLDRLKGLIVGGLTQIKDNSHPFGMTAEEVIAEAVKDYDYPVCFCFPAGHFDDNRALILGRKVKVCIETSISKLFSISFE